MDQPSLHMWACLALWGMCWIYIYKFFFFGSGTHVYQPEVSFGLKPSGTMNLIFETESLIGVQLTHRSGLSRLPPRPHPTNPNVFVSTSLTLALHACATTLNYFHRGSGVHVCIFVLARRELSQLSYLCRSWVCLIEKEMRKVYRRNERQQPILWLCKINMFSVSPKSFIFSGTIFQKCKLYELSIM